MWGEGAIFAFSGWDGPTDSASGFVATLTEQPVGLLLHTPVQRTIQIDYAPELEIVTGDVIAAKDRSLVLTFSAWHTLVATVPPKSQVTLNGDPVNEVGTSLSEADVIALVIEDGRLACAYGKDRAEALARANEGLSVDPEAIMAERMAYFQHAPALDLSPAWEGLLHKCMSVMKVNTLSAGDAGHPWRWSTPDRVPHRHMWLWDSVFHAIAMKHIHPTLAWEFLRSVLEAQNDDGMISHMVAIDGQHSERTQPPILAWGIWETANNDPAILKTALPALERYLNWNRENRDVNHNHLFEWYMESQQVSRADESGMDNSPRFDDARPLDAIDFSVYMAHDYACLAQICAAVGETDKAEKYTGIAIEISQAIHTHLWGGDFYYDRDLDGNLSAVKAWTGFLPLLLDDTPSAHVQQMVALLQDPDHFASAVPVPSVALSDAKWSTDMWRGPTWINANYLIIQGLRRHGYHAEAAKLTEQTLTIVEKYYQQFGVVFEFYDSKDRVTPTQCDRKGQWQAPYDIRRKMDSIRDYHWTAALTLALMIEQQETTS